MWNRFSNKVFNCRFRKRGFPPVGLRGEVLRQNTGRRRRQTGKSRAGAGWDPRHGFVLVWAHLLDHIHCSISAGIKPLVRGIVEAVCPPLRRFRAHLSAHPRKDRGITFWAAYGRRRTTGGHLIERHGRVRSGSGKGPCACDRFRLAVDDGDAFAGWGSYEDSQTLPFEKNASG